MGGMRLGFTPFNAELDYEAAFPLAAELGLDLEVAYDLHEAFPLPGARELRATGEALGVGFTLHLPFVELNPASLIPSVRKLSQERLLRALEFGEALGAKVGVLHTGLIPVRHPVAERLAWEALEETLALLRDPPLPVALENDAKASALSEVFLHGEQNLAYVVLSTGLGVGVVAEGRLLRGATGAFGEVGHWLGEGVSPCRCGRRGCLEVALGLETLVKRYRALGGTASTLEGLLAGARAGEEAALLALRQLGEALGRFLANLAVAYDPARVVVGGRVAELFPFLEASLRASLQAHAFLEAHRRLPVAPSVYGHLAPAVGGASLFLARFFELGGLWAEGPRRNGGEGYAEVAFGDRYGLGA
mgnify:CR=1 FL=1